MQPDLVVVCDPDKIDEAGVLGAPDWIIEVISPSTASRDNIQKLALYEKHGVRHYWLAHPLDRLLTHYCLNQDGLYNRPKIFDMQGKRPSGVLDGLMIDWDEFRG